MMNAQAKVELATVAKLREPFAANQISKLPKESRAQIDERKANRASAINCKVCGGWHHKNAVHLDYVGHAALTDRLLDTDIEWSWEPLAFDQTGLPAFDGNGGLWIKLTVCGVTRLGYGSADGKSGGDAKKEIIGDALRNAAMRFGAALDLWHKGDLHADEDDGNTPARQSGPPANDSNGRQEDGPFPPGPAKNKTELKTMMRELWREVEGCGDGGELDALLAAKPTIALVNQLLKGLPEWWEGRTGGNMPFEGLETVIKRKRDEFAIAAENQPHPFAGG